MIFRERKWKKINKNGERECVWVSIYFIIWQNGPLTRFLGVLIGGYNGHFSM